MILSHSKWMIFPVKLPKIDTRIDEFYTHNYLLVIVIVYISIIRRDDIDTNISKLTKFKTSLHRNFIALQDVFSEYQQHNQSTHTATLNESINHANMVQCSVKAELQTVADRVCAVEGQSAWVATLENNIYNTPVKQFLPSQVPQAFFHDILNSTGIINYLQHNFSSQRNYSPFVLNTRINILQSNFSTLFNTSGLTLDYTRILTYDLYHLYQ